MTIKRRLFISNILMLIMPMFLTVFMGVFVISIIMGIMGIDIRSWRNENISIMDEESALKLMHNKEYTLVADDITIYKTNKHDYIIVLPENDNLPYTFNTFKGNYFIGILIILFLLIVVYLTNRTLIRYVFRSIVTPIDTLAHGVHEIRDGNLSYRIEYNNNDEFSAICSDFNEMAMRLSDMVNARQKDETSRRQLIAGISHDLRTPLTSIKAYIEGIEKGVASTPQAQKRYIDTIKSKTEDLEHIINQLFLFSKLDLGEFPLRLERAEINEVLTDFLYEVTNEYENKGLAVSFVKSPNEQYVNLDIVQFRNVLHNILGNSVKYKLRSVAKSEIVCSESNSNIVISITDDGPGVQAEEIDRLFDVFYRSDISRKDPSSGSGLGLAIAQKTMERLGGTIRAENALEGGITIIITLPKLCVEDERELSHLTV